MTDQSDGPAMSRIDDQVRALIGAIYAEIRRQYDEGEPGPYIERVESNGECVIDGTVDMIALARAVICDLQSRGRYNDDI